MPRLRLKVTHTHAGVAYPPGHVIDVDEHTARWLTERDIGTSASSDSVQAVESIEPVEPAKTRSAKTPKE